ncbi:MAG: energy transducer TonB [Edaphobacter sp.]
MPFFLDSQETSQRFGKHIAEFCSLLDTNHIHHGSPDDLFEFAKFLENNNQFRIDLSALVKSVVQKESDEILLTDMMSIIAASVSGPFFADIRADITKPTNTLMEFLLGTGCWRQFGSPSPPASRREALPLRSPVRVEEPRPLRISPSPSPVPIASETVGGRASLLDASSELRQTLTRLEINTLQVKLHLESIEQRISRIEPSSDVSPAQASLSLEPLPHPGAADTVAGDIAQPIAEGSPAFETELPTRGRAVFSHPTLPERSETDDFSSPTFAYSSEKGRNFIPIGVFLALLVIVAGFLVFAHTRSGDTFLKAGITRLEAVFSNAPATVPRGPTAQSIPAPPIHPATPDDTRPNISPVAPPVSASPKNRYISPNVMEGNLLSAPRPVYPEFARAAHIEGTVALQATISRSGSIRTLHAIKGPQPLRSAAINAVRNWRYKPYTVDGRPVEVATTVYVDFTLKPPPSIAH